MNFLKRKVKIVIIFSLICGILGAYFYYIETRKLHYESFTEENVAENITKMVFSEHIISHLTIADINNDGSVEIIFGTWAGNVVIFNPKSLEVEWYYKIQGDNSHITVAPAVADLNNDEFPDVIVATWSRLIALSPMKHSVLWETIIQEGKAPPIVVDINKDMTPEILINSLYGEIYCINGTNGNFIWTKNVHDLINISNESNVYIWNPGVVIDINNDGILDYIFTCAVRNAPSSEGDFIIMVNGKTGELLRSIYLSHSANPIAVGDLNNDEKPEIIASYIGGILILNSTGSLILNVTLPGKFPEIEGIAIGDINNDGLNEIIVTTFDFHVFAINYYGEILWCSKLEWPPWLTHPILADINGDGILDVIVVGFHHLFYALNGIDGSLIMKYNTSEQLPNTPCAADLDGDGLVEIAFASEKSLYILQTNGTKYFWYSFMGDCRNCGNAMMLVDPFFNPFT